MAAMDVRVPCNVKDPARATPFPIAGRKCLIGIAAAVGISQATAPRQRHRARVRAMQAAYTSAMDHAITKANGRHAAMTGRRRRQGRACTSSPGGWFRLPASRVMQHAAVRALTVIGAYEIKIRLRQAFQLQE